ncbi:DedA family protein [Corynebacterium sp. 3HC-13]|nr:DedA family protein [Corynebacterium poyangense]MBZ8176637.1 DedA family protein [Corynebacterium poyangense]
MSTEDSHPRPELPHYFKNPRKIDYVIFGYMALSVAVGLIALPLRVWLINRPEIYALFIGGFTSAVVGGAHSTAGGSPIVLIVALSLVGALWTVPLWWLVGRHWGAEYLAQLTASSSRTRYWVNRLQKLPAPWLLAATIISYVPFMPTLVICNILSGIKGIKLWLFLVTNAVGVILRNTFFALLGARFGEEVIEVVNQINRYALWVTLILIGVMFYSAYKKGRRTPPPASPSTSA